MKKKMIVFFIVLVFAMSATVALAASGYVPVNNCYKADRPVYVNDYNVNDGLYPVLNYKPDGAAYPYLYIPLAMFQKLGMTVNFDSTTNIAKVTDDRAKTISDQQATIKSLQDQAAQKDKTISDLQNQVNTLQSKLNDEQSKIAVIFNGYVDGYAKFGDSYWEGPQDGLTVGRAYIALDDDSGHYATTYRTIVDDNGKSEIFTRPGLLQPTGMKYIGKTSDGLYQFVPEAGGTVINYKMLEPADQNSVSLTADKTYIMLRNFNMGSTDPTNYSITVNGTNVVLQPV